MKKVIRPKMKKENPVGVKPLENGKVTMVVLKQMITTSIVNRYGSIDAFIKTAEGERFSKNLRTYLYPSASVSYPVLKQLCDMFGIGMLTRKTVVTRSIEYTLVTSEPKQ